MTNTTEQPQPADQVRRFYNEIWNIPDFAVITQIMHPNVTFRGSLGSKRVGHDDFANYVREVTGPLDDYRCDIQAIVAEGDKVAARMLFSGLHRREFLGYSPTGRRVSWSGAAFFTFDAGLITDLWVLGDLVSLHDQLSQLSHENAAVGPHP